MKIYMKPKRGNKKEEMTRKLYIDVRENTDMENKTEIL